MSAQSADSDARSRTFLSSEIANHPTLDISMHSRLSSYALDLLLRENLAGSVASYPILTMYM